MAKTQAVMAQDDPSFDGVQFPGYHTYRGISFGPLRTYYDPVKNGHL